MLFSKLASFVALAVATKVAAAPSPAARVTPDRPRHASEKTEPNPWDNQPLKINTTHWPSTNVPKANLTGGDYVNATGANNTYKIIVPYAGIPGDYLLGYVMDPEYHPMGYDSLFNLVSYVRGDTFIGKMPESWNSDRWIFKTEGHNTYLGINEVYGDYMTLPASLLPSLLYSSSISISISISIAVSIFISIVAILISQRDQFTNATS
ncbi:hypothetical protein BCR34DRAFT_602336 [Clohesyomyces aquaticus]|uniref:Uncharacterized protein n=1 Tax=Clohesyomyces aquaticus TaxID=1231657 RepID=A0A1Y1ZJB4_9PLEO|nr:hypothetical protein BCR34DRAFT_602336 [Clohesyomyces aquaticus]